MLEHWLTNTAILRVTLTPRKQKQYHHLLQQIPWFSPQLKHFRFGQMPYQTQLAVYTGGKSLKDHILYCAPYCYWLNRTEWNLRGRIVCHEAQCGLGPASQSPRCQIKRSGCDSCLHIVAVRTLHESTGSVCKDEKAWHNKYAITHLLKCTSQETRVFIKQKYFTNHSWTHAVCACKYA